MGAGGAGVSVSVGRVLCLCGAHKKILWNRKSEKVICFPFPAQTSVGLQGKVD